MAGNIPHSGEDCKKKIPRYGEQCARGPVARLPKMGNNLKKLRLKAGWTHQVAGDRMGVSRGQFIKLERGERQLKEQWIMLAARAFNVPEQDVISDSPPVLIVGNVGAGSEAHFYEEGQGPFDEAPTIEGAGESTVAVEIQGNSLGPLFDRWLAYYDDLRTPPTHDLVGELCIVGLNDGRVLIKKIARARGNNHFDLWSNAEEPYVRRADQMGGQGSRDQAAITLTVSALSRSAL
jgi:transcriptional regulator with XRE-family HTH domain